MEKYLLHHLLEESARKFPDRVAIVSGKLSMDYKNRSMSYRELDHKSSKISSALKSMGIITGDRIGIYMDKSIESLVFLFGILKAGAAYVPIDTLAPQNRIEYVVNNCSVRIIFTSSDMASNLISLFGKGHSLKKIIISGVSTTISHNQYGDCTIFYAEELYNKSEDDRKRYDCSDTNSAYILHTSGSTGMPKGVGISHLNSLTFVNMAADFFRISKEDRFACHSPLQFDLTVFDIFVAIKRGATIVLVPSKLSVFPMKLAQFIDEFRLICSLIARRARPDGKIPVRIFEDSHLFRRYSAG